jgi:hypothetical protein
VAPSGRSTTGTGTAWLLGPAAGFAALAAFDFDAAAGLPAVPSHAPHRPATFAGSQP